MTDTFGRNINYLRLSVTDLVICAAATVCLKRA